MKSRQQGLALLTVLFTLALLTLLVAQLQARFQIDIDRTTSLQRETQAREYALGAEQLARQLLWEEKQTLLLAGAGRSAAPYPVRRFEPAHGEIHLDIVDLQGRVNLNNIGSNSNLQTLVTTYLRDVMGMAQLEPLLQDWIDNDNMPLPGGAEDSHYESLPEPLKTANQLMTDPSELIVAGNLPESDYASHASAFAALPVPTGLNINAMAAELATLIHPELSPAQFSAARNAQGGYFESVDDFLQSTTTAGVNIDSSLLTVNSQYFSIRSSARVGDHWYHLISRIYQNPETGRLELLDRQTRFSPPFAITIMEDGHGEHTDRIF